MSIVFYYFFRLFSCLCNFTCHIIRPRPATHARAPIETPPPIKYDCEAPCLVGHRAPRGCSRTIRRAVAAKAKSIIKNRGLLQPSILTIANILFKDSPSSILITSIPIHALLFFRIQMQAARLDARTSQTSPRRNYRH